MGANCVLSNPTARSRDRPRAWKSPNIQEGAMRYLPLLFAIPLLILLSGCSGTSLIERENFTSASAREIYIEGHPESAFQENILNGEIIRGMNEEEVIASWGMPNVYLTSKKMDEERFIYYIQDRDVGSVLVYTLDFDADNILFDWDIDEKRLSSYSLVEYDYGVRPAYGSASEKIDKK
jgi:hypothetical protein